MSALPIRSFLSNNIVDEVNVPNQNVAVRNHLTLRVNSLQSTSTPSRKRFGKSMIISISAFIAGLCIVIGVALQLVRELSVHLQIAIAVWTVVWPAIALIASLLFFAQRRKPPKNTMNIQRIQENVRELIQRNIIPCNYTVLSNALVAHIQYPRKIDFPLQLIHLLVISTALAELFTHDLKKQYKEYRKIKKEKLKQSRHLFDVIFSALDNLFNFLDGDAFRLGLFETTSKICKLIDFYVGITHPAHQQRLGHNIGYYVARLHQRLFEISDYYNIDLEANTLEWLMRVDDQKSMYWRRMASCFIEKPPGNEIGRLDYNPTFTSALKRFEIIKNNSQCSFAAAARLWSSPDWNASLSLEENIKRSVHALTYFVIIGKVEHFDGFVIEIPDTERGCYGGSPEALGRTMYRVLKTLSSLDPAGEDVVAQRNMNRPLWQFTFNHQRFFVTSFAPCYPSTSPRYAFGSKSCWILLQPEYSFSYHQLPPSSTPGGIRAKIHENFEKAGRPFLKPSKYDLMGHIYVKPLNDLVDPRISWWSPPPPENYFVPHKVVDINFRCDCCPMFNSVNDAT